MRLRMVSGGTEEVAEGSGEVVTIVRIERDWRQIVQSPMYIYQAVRAELDQSRANFDHRTRMMSIFSGSKRGGKTNDDTQKAQAAHQSAATNILAQNCN